MSAPWSPLALAGALSSGLLAFDPPASGRSGGALLGRPVETDIYGGELVSSDETEYDAVVAVLVGNALCGGTLVAPDVVLTAAHCVDGQTATAGIRVVRGLTASLPLQELDVVAFSAHPDFCETGCPDDLRDFAWLRLAEPINAKLPRITASQDEWNALVGEGSPVELVGYGEAETGNDGRKRKVTTEITGFLAGGRELWAGADGKDSCRGDSGGPAFVRDGAGELVLVGVLSRGRDCGEGGVYGVPQAEACWLREATGVDMAPGCAACDCLSLLPAATGEGCRVNPEDTPGAALLTWLFGAVTLLGSGAWHLRRRRSHTR